MRIQFVICLAFLIGLATSPAVARAADFLVQKAAPGVYKPGLAKSWRVRGAAVIFVLQEGVDGAKAAQAIAEHVPGAKATFEGGTLAVTGLPLSVVLEQLVTLSVTGDDPLGELGALGAAAVASAGSPEGGGSIRASRATEMPGAQGLQLDPHEAFEAEVVEVKRGTFPQVTLRLRVLRPATRGPLAKPLSKGRVIEGSVIYVGGGQPLDLQNADNRRNLGAFYLVAGDKVVAHAQPGAGGQFDRVGLDWVER